MTNSMRLTPVVLALFALGAVGLLVERGARAEEGAAPQSPATWVYDVRVVRVDSPDAAVLEVAPPWQPTGAAGAITSAPWADLLAGLKSRGRTTILLDQRVTAIAGLQADFKQQRKQPVLRLRTRADRTEMWETSYSETGTDGQLTATGRALQYQVNVTWEERAAPDGMSSVGSASWRGSQLDVTAGETLVLSHRQQQGAGAEAPLGLEIYVFVTGWPVAAK